MTQISSEMQVPKASPNFWKKIAKSLPGARSRPCFELREFARARAPEPVLFLTFTKSVQEDQAARCSDERLENVHVLTLDSLALEACLARRPPWQRISSRAGGGQFVILFGAVCYTFCISAYQRCISYVSAVYQCFRTFAFLIRLYQIRIRNEFYMYQ